jgi:CHAT domain-containing protein
MQPLHERVMLFVLQPTGDVEMRVSPMTRDDLLTALDAVREQLRIRSVTRGGAPGPAGSSAGLDALARLGEGLIAPVGDLLVANQPLVVVPYREFTLVPFALLPDRDGVPLVERHALQVVPSLATLWWLRQRGPWQRRRPRRAYIVGDPDLGWEARIAGLEPLPAARAEAGRLADLLVTAGVPEADVVVRQGSDAHVESYRREAVGCDLLHLACHGTLEVPADTSRLYLAPHGPYGSVLLSREIVDVRLNDALVYLSACDTGQGRATADGVIGFGRSFLAAGARAVVVSLWEVDDAAAAALADHVYQHLLTNDDRPTLADALRMAMVATRADLAAGRITTAAGEVLACEAAYWAPFVVLGDGLAVRYA